MQRMYRHPFRGGRVTRNWAHLRCRGETFNGCLERLGVHVGQVMMFEGKVNFKKGELSRRPNHLHPVVKR